MGTGAFNSTEPPPTPTVLSVTPSQGAQGRTLEVTGSNTNFVDGTSVANFGADVQINSTSVVSLTEAVSNLTVLSTATIGLRDVTITTGSQVARESVPGPFLVTGPGALIPRVILVARRTLRSRARIRTLSTNTSLINFSGTGITVNSTTVSLPTTAVANITIAPDAALTLHDVVVTTGAEIVSALGVFQVLVQPMVQFNVASYQISEGVGQATLTVVRSGGTTGPATVEYRTTDTDAFTVGCADTVNNSGGAFGRCDFATIVGSLSFAAGEASKTFTVPSIDDAHVEGNETFNVVLANPTGALLGTPATATITIMGNDVAGATNPISTTPFFVRLHYLDFLSREPEADEPWSGILNRCPDVNNIAPNSPSASCDRINVSAAFFGSPEFQLKGFYVYRFYKVAFNRLPQYAEIIPDMSFVAGATAAEVYQRRAQLAINFTQRPEFQTNFRSLSNSDYVAALMNRYLLTQSTTPDPANPDGTVKITLTSADLVGRLNSNRRTRAQVLRAVADSDEVGAAEFNRAFVAMQYYGYLRRTPEPSGYNA